MLWLWEATPPSSLLLFQGSCSYLFRAIYFSILLPAVPTPAQLCQLWHTSSNTKLLQIQICGGQGGLLQVCQEIQLFCAQQRPQLLGYQVAKKFAAQFWQCEEHALFWCTGWKYSLEPLLSFTRSRSQPFHQSQTTPSQWSVWKSF